MELLLSGILSLVSAAWYFRFLARRRTASPPIVLDSYTRLDGVFLLLLVAWFALNILGSAGREEMVVTGRVLVLNAIVAFFIIVCVVCFLVVRSLDPLRLFGLSAAGWKRSVRVAVTGLLVALPVIFFTHALSFQILGPNTEPQPLMQFLMNSSHWSDRLLLAFTAIVVAPISEELVFRGYMYGAIRRFAGRWWALAISAVLFGAIHAHLPSLGGLIVLAVALTLVYEFTASLWAPILMHAFFNTLSVVVTLCWPDLFQ